MILLRITQFAMAVSTDDHQFGANWRGVRAAPDAGVLFSGISHPLHFSSLNDDPVNLFKSVLAGGRQPIEDVRSRLQRMLLAEMSRTDWPTKGARTVGSFVSRSRPTAAMKRPTLEADPKSPTTTDRACPRE